jgi:chemotaxis protein MotA
MLFLAGLAVVVISVIGGFVAAGGHLMVLWQPFEFLIIFGSAIGGFLIANPKSVLTGTLKSFGMLVKGSPFSKKGYLELLTLLYAIFKLARTKGELALETHVDRPQESALLTGYPGFIRNHAAVEFLCDNLRLLTLGSSNAHELEGAMDAELEARKFEHHAITSALNAVADGLPALGIVAAVLGVIHTMGSITEPPEVLGQLIGGALVGTFSGVLASYGIVDPMARSLENTFHATAQYLECIKIGLIAHTQGYAPQVSIEFARKSLHDHIRPDFTEVDEQLQNVKL